MEFVLIIIGFVLLIKSSDFFVDAATDIAKFFNISEIVIGATIVSIGTTLPETMVSVTSAIKGHGDIAYGNVLGSIICNTALIAATTLVFAPGSVNKKSLKIPVTFFFVSYFLYVIFAVLFNRFDRISGFILFSIFIIYVCYVIKTNIKEDVKEHENNIEKNDDNNFLVLKSVLILVGSAIVIAIASNMLVDNGTLIARRYGVPESVIGLTLIAFGTSLPEFSTAITSIIKGHKNLSIGNVIGANFLNIVNVTGLAAIFSPFELPTSKMINGINSSLIVDIPLVLIVMLILCLPPLFEGKTKRWQGILLYIIYGLFLIYQLKFIGNP